MLLQNRRGRDTALRERRKMERERERERDGNERDGNVAAVSHGQHVPTPTAAAAWCANTAVSKAAWWPWPLTFWPWQWCPCRVWRGLPLCQFRSSYAFLSVLDLGPMYDVQTEQSDVRQLAS